MTIDEATIWEMHEIIQRVASEKGVEVTDLIPSTIEHSYYRRWIDNEKARVAKLTSEDTDPLLKFAFNPLARLCQYCGAFSHRHVIEHIIPRSRGGADHADNFAICCYSCNSAKGSRTLLEWKRWIEQQSGEAFLFAFEMEPLHSFLKSVGQYPNINGRYATDL